MVDILGDFPKFLEEWCHKNHKPLPPEGKVNKIWHEGWKAYMKDYLMEHYDEIKEQYNNLHVLTREEFLNPPEEENIEEPDSSWSRIKQMMEGKND